MVFGNDFGNKPTVLPQNLIKLLTLAEREGFYDFYKMSIIPNRYMGIKDIHGLKTWVESAIVVHNRNKSWLKEHLNPLI